MSVLDLSKLTTKEIKKMYGFAKVFPFVGDFAVFFHNRKYGWIKKDGTILAQGFTGCGNFYDGIAQFDRGISRKPLIGLINSDGVIIADGLKSANYFSEGFIVVKFNSNEKEPSVVQVHYDESGIKDSNRITGITFDYSKNILNYAWLDINGNILKDGFSYCGEFKNGIAPFEIREYWGWIDNKGNILAQYKGRRWDNGDLNYLKQYDEHLFEFVIQMDEEEE